MSEKKLTVAEILARAAKESGDSGTATGRRRRRHAAAEGGITVAELTGSIPAVSVTPEQPRHSRHPLDQNEDISGRPGPAELAAVHGTARRTTPEDEQDHTPSTDPHEEGSTPDEATTPAPVEDPAPPAEADTHTDQEAQAQEDTDPEPAPTVETTPGLAPAADEDEAAPESPKTPEDATALPVEEPLPEDTTPTVDDVDTPDVETTPTVEEPASAAPGSAYDDATRVIPTTPTAVDDTAHAANDDITDDNTDSPGQETPDPVASVKQAHRQAANSQEALLNRMRQQQSGTSSTTTASPENPVEDTPLKETGAETSGSTGLDIPLEVVSDAEPPRFTTGEFAAVTPQAIEDTRLKRRTQPDKPEPETPVADTPVVPPHVAYPAEPTPHDDAPAVGDLKPATHDTTDAVQAEATDQGRVSIMGVIVMAIIGIVIGVALFQGFLFLWPLLHTWVTVSLAVAVTLGFVGGVHAMRTERDGISMFLAFLAGVAVTFGPLIILGL